MSETILNIKSLKVEYNTQEGSVKAVDNLSFSLNKGETLGLVGETGAGKTTTALSIMQLVPNPPGKIVDGEIYFNGINLLNQKNDEMRKIRGNKISMIFQDPMTSLNPVMTVGSQIAETIMLHQKFSKKRAAEKAEEMLDLVGIPKNRAGEYPHQFSGGMRQRVGIAMALSCNPELLISDEPTTALDVTIQAQVLELMKKLKEQFKTSMLLITHDLGVVAEVCDKVAIMYAGKVVEFADVHTLFTKPKHPYTKGLFNSIPSLDEEVDRLKPIKGTMPDPTNLPRGCSFHPRCPYAQEICKVQEPDITELEDGTKVSCLIYQGLVSDGK
ncbi:ABC transporter ATP-binding protein [Serpentinicella sp. ANB-PHB4]|uniref:ABC transporter ATP-binding protein n=1 Tax=Serpentinicella sp. ANB-PHB4 TaxID=3074076 RepID=UPI00285A3C39|nr:ABC transporter ATP-binding protein [Serpentinicella sp. ANB-PHB4]MDR5659842.1 ABC transporter ATP-binding protein [Serpentinicella sp. ANB-PHB4]